MDFNHPCGILHGSRIALVSLRRDSEMRVGVKVPQDGLPQFFLESLSVPGVPTLNQVWGRRQVSLRAIVARMDRTVPRLD